MRKFMIFFHIFLFSGFSSQGFTNQNYTMQELINQDFNNPVFSKNSFPQKNNDNFYNQTEASLEIDFPEMHYELFQYFSDKLQIPAENHEKIIKSILENYDLTINSLNKALFLLVTRNVFEHHIGRSIIPVEKIADEIGKSFHEIAQEYSMITKEGKSINRWKTVSASLLTLFTITICLGLWYNQKIKIKFEDKLKTETEKRKKVKTKIKIKKKLKKSKSKKKGFWGRAASITKIITPLINLGLGIVNTVNKNQQNKIQEKRYLIFKPNK